MRSNSRRAPKGPGPFVRAVAIGAAPMPPKYVKATLDSLESEARTLAVGIDGGARFLRKRPEFQHQIWVGDWDSLGEAPRDGSVDLLHLPSEKDRSDLAYALAVLHALQARGDARLQEVVLLGVTGGRPDHQLAGLLEIVDASVEFDTPVLFRMLGPDAEWFAIHARRPLSVTFSAKAGDPVSLFSLDCRTKLGGLRGLRFAGDGAGGFTLSAGSHGLSNEATGGRVEVRLDSGTLLGVLPKDAQRGGMKAVPNNRDWTVKAGKAK